MNYVVPMRDLGRALSWNLQAAILMIYAYLDESGEYENRKLVNMSIGCCVASLENWGKFETCLAEAMAVAGLRDCEFHMSDFEAWRAPFNFLLPSGARDHDRHKRLMNAILESMLGNIERFAGFTVFGFVSPDSGVAHAKSIEECINSAVSSVFRDLWEHYQQPVNLIFDRQKHFCLAHIEKMFDAYQLGFGEKRFGSLVFEDSSRIKPLQAADLLAYEMSKVQREDRQDRYPFLKLQEGCRQRNLPLTLSWKELI